MTVFDTDNRTDLSVDASVAGAIIGGVIGGVSLIAVGSAIVCWCVSGQEPSQGRVLYMTQGYPSKYKNATRKLQMLHAFASIGQVPCITVSQKYVKQKTSRTLM